MEWLFPPLNIELDLHKKFYFLGGGISVSACYMDCLFFLIFLIFLRHYL